MEIWPAIDMRGGQCVRLRQGDYTQETVYEADPAQAAQHWVELGAKRFHLVDLDGAREGRPVNTDAVRRIIEKTGVPCELGGGIRTEEAIQELLDIGLSRLVIGTLALKEPDWFRRMSFKFPQKLVLGIDARNGFVATDGWLKTSQTSAIELARQFQELPIAALIYTDIATDGMMKGPNIEAMREMMTVVPFPVVASGGVTTLNDIQLLAEVGLPAVIIGRALYEGSITLPDALAWE